MARRRLSAFASAVALGLVATPSLAEPFKLKIACTATSDCASAMVARDQGIFAKHGLDADVTLIGINTNIPPAIASDSIQIGGPTSPVFLQAVDGGLDLVAVAGASVMDPERSKTIAAVARPGVSIKEPKDFVGKKVGAPGIGAFLHVLFRKWLIEKGVDPESVNFVEVTFPTMNDALKSGSVDAVLTAEPFVTRITKAGNGRSQRSMQPTSPAPIRSSSTPPRASSPRSIPTSSRRSAPRSRRLRRSSIPTVRRRPSRSRNSPRCRSTSFAKRGPISPSPS